MIQVVKLPWTNRLNKPIFMLFDDLKNEIIQGPASATSTKSRLNGLMQAEIANKNTKLFDLLTEGGQPAGSLDFKEMERRIENAEQSK